MFLLHVYIYLKSFLKTYYGKKNPRIIYDIKFSNQCQIFPIQYIRECRCVFPEQLPVWFRPSSERILDFLNTIFLVSDHKNISTADLSKKIYDIWCKEHFAWTFPRKIEIEWDRELLQFFASSDSNLVGKYHVLIMDEFK